MPPPPSIGDDFFDFCQSFYAFLTKKIIIIVGSFSQQKNPNSVIRSYLKYPYISERNTVDCLLFVRKQSCFTPKRNLVHYRLCINGNKSKFVYSQPRFSPKNPLFVMDTLAHLFALFFRSVDAVPQERLFF